MDYTQRQRWILWFLPIVVVLWLISGVVNSDDVFGKLQIGLGVVYLLALPFAFWQRRRVIERTQRALDRAGPI